MEEKNLDADQRIELIQQMIRGTRQRLSFGSSNLFLLWGYLLAATAIVIFVLLKTTDCRTWLWLWLPAATTGGAVTWWHNRFRAPQVKSYTDRLLEQIWSCIASLVVLSAILICGYDPWAVDPLFPALLLIGAGLCTTRHASSYRSASALPATRGSMPTPTTTCCNSPQRSSSGSRVPAMHSGGR